MDENAVVALADPEGSGLYNKVAGLPHGSALKLTKSILIRLNSASCTMSEKGKGRNADIRLTPSWKECQYARSKTFQITEKLTVIGPQRNQSLDEEL